MDRDAQTRKSHAELGKVRKQRDLLEQKIPTMDTNIDQLQAMLEKMQKDNEKEVKRRETAVKEKENAFEKLRVYQEVYEQLKINDPGKFRKDYNDMQDELVNLNKQLAEKAKQMQSKEKQFKVREEELKTQKRKVTNCLNEMADWTITYLNFDAISAGSEKQI